MGTSGSKQKDHLYDTITLSTNSTSSNAQIVGKQHKLSWFTPFKRFKRISNVINISLSTQLQISNNFIVIDTSSNQSPIPSPSLKTAKDKTNSIDPTINVTDTVQSPISDNGINCHKCWFVGNNEFGQFGDHLTNENIYYPVLMNTLPHDININNIITTRYISNGATHILSSNNKHTIITGCTEHGNLSIGHINIILYYWFDDIDIPTNIVNISSLITMYLYNDNDKLNAFKMECTFIDNFGIKILTNYNNNNQSCILTRNNQLNGNGLNQHSIKEESLYKKIITDISKIDYFTQNDIKLKDIQSTCYYTIYLTNDGNLYICGVDEFVNDLLNKCDNKRNLSTITPGNDINDINDINDTLTKEFMDHNKMEANLLNLHCIKQIFSIKTKIISICCGCDHVLAINECGNVLSFGFGEYGQLGHGNDANIYKPKLIEYLIINNIFIIRISCGAHHNIILDSFGNVYCFGLNNRYQCGNRNNKQNVYLPYLNKTLINLNIINIKCGYHHNVVTSNLKEYYLWGDNEFNQCLIYDDKQQYIKYPTKYDSDRDLYNVFFPAEIVEIYPGWRETRIVTT